VERVDYIHLAQDRDKRQAVLNTIPKDKRHRQEGPYTVAYIFRKQQSSLRLCKHSKSVYQFQYISLQRFAAANWQSWMFVVLAKILALHLTRFHVPSKPCDTEGSHVT
jgi:hypothetical protein